MESRYALRELECAIGYDCRFLADGRKAVFRHTSLHKRARRDFYARRDVLMVLQATLLSAASLGSHPRANLKTAADLVIESRKNLIHIAFPYLENEPVKPQKEDYDAYFDELEAYLASKKKTPDKVGESSDAVGDGSEK